MKKSLILSKRKEIQRSHENMRSITKFSKILLMPNKKIILQSSLMLFLLCGYPVQAQSQAIIGQTYKTTEQNKKLQREDQQDEWLTFPCTIQISPYIGFTKKIPQLLVRKSKYCPAQSLRILGGTIDIGVLQIRKFIWKYFHCYPKLGFVLNYGRFENKGYLAGGLIYLEPQYNYLSKWEIAPRLGIGLSYAKIPLTNFKKPTPEEKEAEINNDEYAEFFYRKGLHLDLLLALAVRIRLTPHWQLSPSIGFSYMPLIVDDNPNKLLKSSEKDNNLKYVTGSISFGYTPNPSIIHYPSVGSSKKSRIDIGFLSTFKKFKPTLQQSQSQSQTNQQENTDSEGKYYYVGGIYGQWSLQLCRNHAITLATEWIHDGAAKQALKNKIKTSPLKIGVLLGHEFRFGKFTFGKQLGLYLMTNETADQGEHILYARMGLAYKLTDSFFIGTSLKAIMLKDNFSIKTDFIDFRVGYSF